MYAATTFAANTEPTTLCHSEETVVFSCSAKKKLVSLCATSDLTAEGGRLTYRYGVPGKPPELIYPTVEVKPKEAFTATFMEWARRSYQAVSFKISDYAYTVYFCENIESCSQDVGAGVTVERSGKVIADLWCDVPYQNNMWEKLRSVGLPEPEAP